MHVECLPLITISYSLERGPLTNPEAHFSARLASKLPGSFCPSSPPQWCCRHIKSWSALYVDTEDTNLNLYARIANVLNSLSHLPYFFHILKKIHRMQRSCIMYQFLHAKACLTSNLETLENHSATWCVCLNYMWAFCLLIYKMSSWVLAVKNRMPHLKVAAVMILSDPCPSCPARQQEVPKGNGRPRTSFSARALGWGRACAVITVFCRLSRSGELYLLSGCQRSVFL